MWEAFSWLEMNTAQRKSFYKCQLQLKLYFVTLRSRHTSYNYQVEFDVSPRPDVNRKGKENSADEHTSLKRKSKTFICSVKQSLYVQLHEFVIRGHLILFLIFTSFLFTRQPYLLSSNSTRRLSNTNEFEISSQFKPSEIQQNTSNV